MVFYYTFFVIFGLLAFLEYCKDTSDLLNQLFPVTYLFLLFVFGFRYDVGIDWYNYKTFFENVEPITNVVSGIANAPVFYSAYSMEFGYKLFNSILVTFGFGFQFLIFIISFFNITVLYYFILKLKVKYKYTFLAAFLSLTMFREFDIYRQSISFYLFLISFTYVGNSKTKYFLINLLGILFHSSSIVFFIVYPFLKIRITKIHLKVILIVFFVSFLFVIPFVTWLLQFLTLIPFVDSFAIKILAFYKYLNFAKGLGLTISLPCFVFLVLLVERFDKISDLSHEYKMMICLFLLYLYTSILFGEIEEVVTRIGYFFLIGIAFLFAIVPLIISAKYLKYYSIVPILYALFKLNLMMSTPASRITYSPYTNYLFEFNEDRSKRINDKRSSTEIYYLDKTNK